MHCDTPLDRPLIKFIYGNTPHCVTCDCSVLGKNWKMCVKTQSKKGKRFLKNRKKAVKEHSLKHDTPQTTATCEECNKACLTVRLVLRRRKYLCKGCRDDKDIVF